MEVSPEKLNCNCLSLSLTFRFICRCASYSRTFTMESTIVESVARPLVPRTLGLTFTIRILLIVRFILECHQCNHARLPTHSFVSVDDSCNAFRFLFNATFRKNWKQFVVGLVYTHRFDCLHMIWIWLDAISGFNRRKTPLAQFASGMNAKCVCVCARALPGL